MKKSDIEPFFRCLSERIVAPKTELSYTNPYTLLVAVVLSAQATDVGVNKATAKLFGIVDTPKKMLDLGIDGLKAHIKTIGLYNNKAKNVMALSERLIAEHASRVPDDRDALERLPGVGRKTANVILNEVFGHHTIAVDTHIFRVANRTGLARGKTPLAVEHGLEKCIPATYKRYAHHWLLLHGRYVCKARKPDCSSCDVTQFCCFPDKNDIQSGHD